MRRAATRRWAAGKQGAVPTHTQKKEPGGQGRRGALVTRWSISPISEIRFVCVYLKIKCQVNAKMVFHRY